MTTKDGLPTMTTFTGKLFNFIDPDPESIDIKDIAHGLSLECRFQNQSKVHYSVAQHSVLVSRYLTGIPIRRSALLHDAAEAYLGDVCKPLKRLLPDYQKIEDRVQKAIFRRFGLPEETPPEVKEVDMRLLATEGISFMGKDWRDAAVPPDPSIPLLEAWPAWVAEETFLGTYELLFH